MPSALPERPALVAEDIRPLHDQILIRKRLSERATFSGMLLIPENARFRDHIADVVAVGDEVRDVRTGDVVIVRDLADAGRKVRLADGDVVSVVQEADLLGVIEEDDAPAAAPVSEAS